MPLPQIWPKRQEVQQMSAIPAPIKEVERTNTIVVRNLLQKQEEREERIRRDLYVINVDKERNCYSCEGFGHIAKNCRNQSVVGQERRIEYGNNLNIRDNLKEKKSQVVLN